VKVRLVALACVALALTLSTAAQTPAASASRASTSSAPPDLQGTWYIGSATPLERPRELEGKAFLTAEEAADFEQKNAQRLGGVLAVHSPEWLDYGRNVVPDRRTSLIIDPPDGRVPPLTPEAQAKAAARRARAQKEPADGPESRTIAERCLVFGAGPPILPGPYNNNIEIVQTGGSVVVFTEMIHDARIVPLDGRPPLPRQARFWLGSSRGRWEGRTLVIETTNFAEPVTFRGSDENLKVIERFTLERPDALRYEFTVDDPTAFTKPWTGAFTMTRSPEMVYEYACHEGNYGLMNMLRAARAEEQETARER
jgi:hypothetical protein